MTNEKYEPDYPADCEEVCAEPIRLAETGNNERSGQMWAVSGTNRYMPCDHAVKSLLCGQYIIDSNPSMGLYFEKKDVVLDDLLVLPDSESENVIEGISEFWTKEEKYRELGFLWKRGIMLYGPPGSGKTSTVQQLSKQIVDLGGIAIYATNPHVDAQGLRLLRRIEPKRPIVLIMEDLDAIIRNFGESDVLALLDGELQIDNMVVVATTNYPERLDKRIMNRPSRFDEVIHIGMPSAEARELFLTKKNTRLLKDADELAEWVRVTEGYSIAHLKEVIISVECRGKSLSETIARLDNMIENEPNSDDDYHRQVGFTPTSGNTADKKVSAQY